MTDVFVTNWPAPIEPISKLYDAATGQLVPGYSISEVINAMTKLGQDFAIAGTLFIVTLVAWALVRYFIGSKEVLEDE